VEFGNNLDLTDGRRGPVPAEFASGDRYSKRLAFDRSRTRSHEVCRQISHSIAASPRTVRPARRGTSRASLMGQDAVLSQWELHSVRVAQVLQKPSLRKKYRRY
jgi:hypothetical protein